MKIANAERQIERISTTTERQFTIKATGKAFRILSSGLYKDKILAVVRELSCNAYDAHIAAGCKQRPFDVHLPNQFEPFFSVRDYGPALSPHQIETVFTTYFESTKTDSNDQIGGLGLGCKSPLSYVDSFNVISRYDGVKRTYTVFFDEDDTPSMVLMSEEDITDYNWEPNGLEVKLPVRSDNFYEFNYAAEQVFKYFDVTPNVVGNADFKLQQPISSISGPNYNVTTDGRSARAIMGVVSYPIDKYQVDSKARGILSSAIDLYFDVGDLDITAGREELSYDRRTKDMLNKRVSEVLSDLPNRIVRRFSKCKNQFEARKLYGEIISGYPEIKSLFPNSSIPYRGDLIDSASFSINVHDFKNLVALRYDRPKMMYNFHPSQRLSDRLIIRSSDVTRLFYDDCRGVHIASRIRKYREDNPNVEVTVFRTADAETLNAITELFKGKDIVNLSTLERSAPIQKSPTSVMKLCYNRKAYGGSIVKNSWDRVVIDPSEGGIYVPTVSGTVQYQGGGLWCSNFSEVYSNALKLKLFDTSKELFSIPKSLISKFSDQESWDNYFDVIKEAFIQKMAEEKWAEGMARSSAISNFSKEYSHISSEMPFMIALSQKLREDHPIVNFVNAWKIFFGGKNVDYSIHIALGKFLNVEMPIAPVKDDVSAIWKDSDKKYTMIRYMFRLSSWNRDLPVMLNEAIEYISAVDGKSCLPAEQ